MGLIELIPTIPPHPTNELIISTILCLALAFFAYWKHILSWKGSVLSFVIGIVISIFADIYWLITLILFLAITFTVTKLKYGYKKSKGVAQGKLGERRTKNVLANGTVPMFIALFSSVFESFRPGLAGLLFITGISIAASDTFASEIGVLSNKVYLITNPKKRVRVGTDGGVSRLGLASAFIGALIPSVLGWLFISDFIKLPYHFVSIGASAHFILIRSPI